MRLRRQAKTTAAPTAWRLGCSTGVDRRDPAFQQHCCLGCGLLTVKLRGRARRQAALRSNEVLKAPRKRPEGRRGRTLSPGARGAKQTTHHGPLQRLLDFECLLRMRDLRVRPTLMP